MTDNLKIDEQALDSAIIVGLRGNGTAYKTLREIIRDAILAYNGIVRSSKHTGVTRSGWSPEMKEISRQAADEIIGKLNEHNSSKTPD